MKITILSTVTNPEDRQDKWKEALECYMALAEEVVIVNGGFKIDISESKVKVIDLGWSYEWNWIELPRHLNAGLDHCTGDWVLKLDIDQFIHEKDFSELRDQLSKVPIDIDAVTLQKKTLLYSGKYYEKGGGLVAFRNRDYIRIGKNTRYPTDLCFPIVQRGTELVDDYELPTGVMLRKAKIGISYWNYDYFFKTQEFTRKEFWRFSKAYQRYYGTWRFGGSEEDSFEKFINGMKGRFDNAPYKWKLKDHPIFIREAVENLTLEQFGYNAWSLI